MESPRGLSARPALPSRSTSGGRYSPDFDADHGTRLILHHDDAMFVIARTDFGSRLTEPDRERLSFAVVNDLYGVHTTSPCLTASVGQAVIRRPDSGRMTAHNSRAALIRPAQG